MMSIGQDFARALADDRDAAARPPRLAEQNAQMNDALRAAAGFGKVVEDAAGTPVRDAQGRFLTGQGNDGGSRGGEGLPQTDDSPNAAVNAWLRGEASEQDNGPTAQMPA
jgi:hypothetical protein